MIALSIAVLAIEAIFFNKPNIWRLPVIFALDRAGITGPDGASHHGVYDMALLSKVPGMRVLAPSSAQELHVMLHDAVTLADEGPVVIRYPRGDARQVDEHDVGVGVLARALRTAADPATSVCILAIGKMVGTALKAAEALAVNGVDVSVWDVRCCAPLDPAMSSTRTCAKRPPGTSTTPSPSRGAENADQLSSGSRVLPVRSCTRTAPPGGTDRLSAMAP